jgi:hypothetical protein
MQHSQDKLELVNKLLAAGEQLEAAFSHAIKDAMEVFSVEDLKMMVEARGGVMLHPDLEIDESTTTALRDALSPADLTVITTDEYNTYYEAYQLMESSQEEVQQGQEEEAVENGEEEVTPEPEKKPSGKSKESPAPEKSSKKEPPQKSGGKGHEKPAKRSR